jgi:hypothetical protein
MSRTKSPSWYLKKIPQEEIAYLLAGREVIAVLREFREDKAIAAAAGEAWSVTERNQRYRDAIKASTKSHILNASKMAPMWDPVLENFMEKCSELFAFTSRLKRQKPTEREVMTLSVNRARLFTQVNMSNELRFALIEAHCDPEKRKAWFHPALLANKAVKQWMFTWNMWSTFEGIVEAILNVILEEIVQVKITKVGKELDEAEAAERAEEIKLFKSKAIEEFGIYRREVKGKYFHNLWFVKYGSTSKDVKVETLWRRAKRYVYRIFIAKERKDATFFPMYPACFRIWNKVDSPTLLKEKFPKDSNHVPCQSKCGSPNHDRVGDFALPVVSGHSKLECALQQVGEKRRESKQYRATF